MIASPLLKISLCATTKEKIKTPDVARFAVRRAASRALSHFVPSKAPGELNLIEIEGGSDFDETAHRSLV